MFVWSVCFQIFTSIAKYEELSPLAECRVVAGRGAGVRGESRMVSDIGGREQEQREQERGRDVKY